MEASVHSPSRRNLDLVLTHNFFCTELLNSESSMYLFSPTGIVETTEAKGVITTASCHRLSFIDKWLFCSQRMSHELRPL